MRTVVTASVTASLWLIPFVPFAQAQVFTQKTEIAPSVVVGKEPTAVATDNSRFKRGPRPSWIWGADQNVRYIVRRTFETTATKGAIKGSCDNHVVVYLNGKRLGTASDWQRPFEYRLDGKLKKGKNSLVAVITNQGSAAGFVAKVVLSGKKPQYVVTDSSWNVTRHSRKALAAALKNGGDLTWSKAKVHGKLGTGPWGNVFDRTAAPPARGMFVVRPGFQVERLFAVPKGRLGSWVAITFDHRGRLIASDQGNRGLCRVTVPPLGGGETKVERLKVNISSAQGLLYAFNSLYVSVNGGRGSGLYRLRDTNGDDQYDEVKLLSRIRGGGEHGPHALRLAPDGKSIYWIAGNHTNPPKFVHSNLPKNWSEDLLLPRRWDARGHARGRLAPGGWIARTDPNGQEMVMVSSGYRNPYDMAFNADGELFAYDADMEWDMGSPWYRPTRVVHATSGSEFGWRSGTGKWPEYFPDSLPATVDVGPGSPVGAEFGYGTRFPAKYQRALYICDWTFGTMYAIHLTPHGASYVGRKEEFVSRAPLPLTDVAVGPDGALYFTVGGRGAQSELYRVTYVGKASTAAAKLTSDAGAELRKIRRRLESMHSRQDKSKIAGIMLYLGHPDRHIRYAARIALENQPYEWWRDQGQSFANADAAINFAIAVARQGKTSIDRYLSSLGSIRFTSLSERSRLDLLRAYQLGFIRIGPPTKAQAASLAKALDPFYPAKSDSLNRELCRVLVYLQSPTVATKTIALMKQKRKLSPEQMSKLLARNRGYGGTIARMLANQPDKQKLHYAFVLRNLKVGWTKEQKMFYFRWLNDEQKKTGGASYRGFITNMANDAFENSRDVERLAVVAAGLRKPYRAPKLPKPRGPGKNWTAEEVIKLAKTKLRKRNFGNGKRAFAAARCVVCHRFGGDGGATGPDLTQLAGRFNVKDLTESILLPSKVISDQYRGSIVVTEGGDVKKGKIVSETKESITLLVDPEDATKVVQIARGNISRILADKQSLMPADLLKPLNQDEVLDLLAYLLSRGNPRSEFFR